MTTIDALSLLGFCLAGGFGLVSLLEAIACAAHSAFRARMWARVAETVVWATVMVVLVTR